LPDLAEDPRDAVSTVAAEKLRDVLAEPQLMHSGLRPFEYSEIEVLISNDSPQSSQV